MKPPVNVQNAIEALTIARKQACEGALNNAASQVRVALGWLQLPRDIAAADVVLKLVTQTKDDALAEAAIFEFARRLIADYTTPEDQANGDAIKPGDVVRLRSGGPLMTVGQIFPASKTAQLVGQHVDFAQCYWHDEQLVAQQGSFAAPGLERIEPKVASLVHIALALWDGERADGYGEGRCFDYCQSPGGHELVEAFAAVLTEIDGKPRKWQREPR